MLDYLKGWDELHGAPAGPMASITHDLVRARGDDLRAISDYVASVEGPPSPERREYAANLIARLTSPENATVGSGGSTSSRPRAAGSAVEFTSTCGGCHTDRGTVSPAGAINLSLSTPINSADARNAIHIVMQGLRVPREGVTSMMPGFSDALDDDQIAKILQFARAHFTNQPPWRGLRAQIRAIRAAKQN
jgi:mono/diheme cytochrome c family protein